MKTLTQTAMAGIAAILLLPGIAGATSYDFEYSYTNPYWGSSQTYIVSTSNMVLYTEGVVRTWKPHIGGSTFANTTPGVATYHFDFDTMGYTDPISEIFLWMNMPIFHWNYSQGHNILYGSNDGTNWTQMAELRDAPFGGAKDLGLVNVPTSLLGASDLWLKAELYSYGPSASGGGANTNTSQLSRYATSSNNTAFNIGVNFEPQNQQGPGGSVPVPATLALFSLGLLGLKSRGFRIGTR